MNKHWRSLFSTEQCLVKNTTVYIFGEKDLMYEFVYRDT